MALVALGIAFAGLTPLHFPAAPRSTWVAGVPIERMLEGEKRLFGTRFDGWRRRRVEWALWLSPELVGRWVAGPDAQRKWDVIRPDLVGRVTFVVRLSTYPKAPVADLFDGKPPEPAELDRPVFLASAAPRGPYTRCDAVLLERHQARTEEALSEFKWWRTLPWADVLEPRAQGDNGAPMFPLGDYHAAYWLVSAPAPSWWSGSQKVFLWIEGERRRRSVTFERRR